MLNRLVATMSDVFIPQMETVPLQKFIKKAWVKETTITPFTAEPMLRRSKKNRIIYYIGSFNPPHLGHLALISHVFQNSQDQDEFNAIAVIVLAHAEGWVKRKVSSDESPLHLTFDERLRLLEASITKQQRDWLWIFPVDVGGWWGF